MNKLMQFLLVWVFLCLGLSAHAQSHQINPNWTELSQVQYIDNLVACELALQRHKWSLNVWPEANNKPKPDFSEVVEVDKVWQQVIDNLTLQSILAENFNTIISDEMLQHDLDRMASNSKDAKGLKALFELFDNNPNTIAQCISRPYLVKQKTLNNYNFNVEIHAKSKALAETELESILNGLQIDELKAQVTTITYEIEKNTLDIESDLFEAEKTTIQLSKEAYYSKLQQLENIDLQENEYAFFYTELLEQSDSSIKIKTLTWEKVKFDLWLQAQNADIYFPKLKKQSLQLPTITGSNSLPESKAGAMSGTWETKYYAPDGREFHTAIWSGSEMIVWGGYDDNNTNTGGRYSPTTDSWVATSVGTHVPSPRQKHTAIWSGSEMIVWGGNTTNAGGQVNTGGRYNPTTDTWTATSTAANVPTVRDSHTAIWTGTKMIVWGGFDYSTFLNTGGLYDPSDDSWKAISLTNAPSGRYRHTAIWSDSEMIIWGGLKYGGNRLNTGGRYDPDNDDWIATSVGANVPGVRTDHTAVWSGTEMIIWGGKDTGYLNTGGRYNPATDSWIATSTANNVPSERDKHTAIWTGSEMLIWGGYGGGFNYLNTGSRYNPSSNSWSTIGEAPNVPSGRYRHTAIWSGTEMIIWGGLDRRVLNTGGRYNPANNSWIASGMNKFPSAREFHTAIWSGSEMIVWGGRYKNTGGRYNPATDNWLTTDVGTGVPSGRYWHTAIWTGSKMIVWGGLSIDGNTNTGGRYDPLNDSWQATSLNANVPSVRQNHTATWSGNEMIIWGGYGAGYLNTGGRYDPVDDSWIMTSMVNAPSNRQNHTAIWIGSELIIWGGHDSNSSTNTGGLYDPVADSWIATSVDAQVPSVRQSHTAVWTGSEMIVWGGADGVTFLNTGGRYDPVNDSWIATSVGINVPIGRFLYSTVWSGSEMIIWGGVDINDNKLNTGGRYNPDTDDWIATSLDANVPSARNNHTGIWTGNQMLIWGGLTPLPTNSLGIYSPYDNYSISGTLSGLVGNQVTLQNNGGDDLTLTTNGAFQFNATLAEGSYYEVTVLSNPQSPAQTCTVTNSSGYITTDVTNVIVQCNTLVDLIFRDGFDPGPTDLIFRDGFEGP